MPPIFFDADCLILLTFVRRLDILYSLYAGRIYVPDVVYTIYPYEIQKPWQRNQIDDGIQNGHITIAEIAAGSPEHSLYLKLKTNCNGKRIGSGEAAVLALAKSRDGVIASNNLRDIGQYAIDNNIQYTTTSRILVEATNKGLILLEEGNEIWDTLAKNQFRLPKGFSTFADFYANPT